MKPGLVLLFSATLPLAVLCLAALHLANVDITLSSDRALHALLRSMQLQLSHNTLPASRWATLGHTQPGCTAVGSMLLSGPVPELPTCMPACMPACMPVIWQSRNLDAVIQSSMCGVSQSVAIAAVL